MGCHRTEPVVRNKARKLKKCSVLIKAEVVCGFPDIFTSQRAGNSSASSELGKSTSGTRLFGFSAPSTDVLCGHLRSMMGA